MTSIWQTLSAIDCREHTEKKGGFDYLSWTWAWAMVKERFPAASYRLEDDIMYLDGTMEVRVTVTIEDLQHTMWLPVLDFKNKAISKPNAFDINSARMRCLVKCLAMFGLGHYIYAGESAPQAEAPADPIVAHLEAVARNMSAIQYIKDALSRDEYETAYEAFQEISVADREALWVAPTKGGKAWTTKEIAQFKSNEWGAARKVFNGLQETAA